MSTNSDVAGMGAYYSEDETVQSMYLSEIPEEDWLNDDVYALVHIDQFGNLRVAGVKFSKPTRLENDNSGGVLIARDAASMHRSRATAMRAVFCQECVERGMYDPVHVPSEEMTADVLTKWLPLNLFAKHRAKLSNRRAQSKLLGIIASRAASA